MARVYGVPREIEPALGIREEIWRTAGAISWLGEIVAGLKQQDVIFGTTRLGVRADGQRAGDIESSTAVREAKLNLWVELLFRERRHFAEICAKAVALGLADREVQIAEQQANGCRGRTCHLSDKALELNPRS